MRSIMTETVLVKYFSVENPWQAGTQLETR